MSSKESGSRNTPDNRVSVFPRPKNTTYRPKRHLADVDFVGQGTKESAQKLQKYRPDALKFLSKTASNPWLRYRKTFRMNQAGIGWVVHSNDTTFREGIIKEVKTTKSEMSKIMTTPHKNFVQLQEALYHDNMVFLVYELMDVSLAQIFGSPLGRLQLFEVAAFSYEILTGIEYIHRQLQIIHGDISSTSILLSVTGALKIGIFR